MKGDMHLRVILIASFLRVQYTKTWNQLLNELCVDPLPSYLII